MPQQEPQAVQDQAQAETDAQQGEEKSSEKPAEEPDCKQELAKQKDAFLRLYASHCLRRGMNSVRPETT